MPSSKCHLRGEQPSHQRGSRVSTSFQSSKIASGAPANRSTDQSCMTVTGTACDDPEPTSTSTVTLLVHPYLVKGANYINGTDHATHHQSPDGTSPANADRTRTERGAEARDQYSVRRDPASTPSARDFPLFHPDMPVEYIDMRIVGDAIQGPIEDQPGCGDAKEYGTRLAASLAALPGLSEYYRMPSFKGGEIVAERLIGYTDTINTCGRGLIRDWVKDLYHHHAWHTDTDSKKKKEKTFQCDIALDTRDYLGQFPVKTLVDLRGVPLDVGRYREITRKQWGEFEYEAPTHSQS